MCYRFSHYPVNCCINTRLSCCVTVRYFSFNILQCIRLADGYDMKRKCTRETVRLIKKLHPEPHPLYSHQSLELMVNTCVLEQLRGKPPSEAIAAIKALPHYSSKHFYLLHTIIGAHTCTCTCTCMSMLITHF